MNNNIVINRAILGCTMMALETKTPYVFERHIFVIWIYLLNPLETSVS